MAYFDKNAVNHRVFDRIQDAVLLIDPTGTVVFMNAAAKNIGMSYNPSMKEGCSFLDMVSKERLTIIEPNLKNAIEKNISSVFETSFAVNGRHMFFDVRVSPVTDASGGVEVVMLEIRDISLQKVYEGKIISAANDLKRLIEYANALIVGIDVRGYITEWNSFASKITGYSGSESLRKHFSELLSSEDSITTFPDIIAETLVGKDLSNLEVVLRTKDNNKRITLINATPRRNSNDEIVGALIIGQDISELATYRKSLERKVRERTLALEVALDKEKELVEIKNRFVSIASHEFRSPISVISHQADWLMRTLSDSNNSEMIDRVGKISELANHMSALLEDVLLIGKSEAGKIKPSMDRVDLIAFFNDLAQEISQTCNDSHKMVMKFSSNALAIESDRNILRNIFVNLLSNAIKFSPEKDEIFLTVNATGSVIEIIVEDKGIGIQPDEVDKIFLPFSRGSNAEKIKGTGLGLSIVKKAVESVNGRVWVESQVGHGTTFTVQLNLINHAKTK